MKFKTRQNIAATCLALGVFLSASIASALSWTDWSTTNSGVMTIGTNTVNVSLTGMADSLVNGDYYYNNAATGGTAVTGTYMGLKPSDMIQEWGVGRVTLNFSEAIIDPYLALVSVGQPGTFNVNYTFQNLQAPINVLSSGANYWGYGGYSVNGNTFSGHEYNGILQLAGTYQSLTFDIAPGEFWHGFNIGSAATSDAAAVPEPSTMLLLGGGLAGLAFWRRKKNA